MAYLMIVDDDDEMTSAITAVLCGQATRSFVSRTRPLHWSR